MKRRAKEAVQVKEADDYSSATYWDKRYSSSSNNEWYYSYEILRPLFEKCMGDSFTGNVLEIGCGDKPLICGLEDLVGDKSALYGIDYSKAIIDILNTAQKQTNGRVIYKEMDARKMVDFEDNTFELVVDKGTIDAMLCPEDEETAFSNVRGIINESLRIMKPDKAQYMIVSHLEVDSPEFNSILRDCLLPCLDGHRGQMWRIEAHVVKRSRPSEEESSLEPQSKTRKTNTKTNDTAANVSGNGTVYIIHSTARKITRNMMNSPAEVTFEVLEYSDSEGEGDEEDED
jgi:ubiquinone/menaquinone biosynthesis C-methylase UbiE